MEGWDWPVHLLDRGGACRQNLVAQGTLAEYSTLFASAVSPLIQPFLARTVRKKGERKGGRQRKESITGSRQSQTRGRGGVAHQWAEGAAATLNITQTLQFLSEGKRGELRGPAMLLCPVTTCTLDPAPSPEACRQTAVHFSRASGGNPH